MSRIGTWAAMVVIAVGVTVCAGQARWNLFRGPDSAGIDATGKALPAELDPGKNVRWRVDVPPGLSSPCIWGDRLFLTAHEKDEFVTLCLDRRTGKTLWRRALPAGKLERTHRINGPATPTPATDGNVVCCYFGSFGLVVYDVAGKKLWQREIDPARNIFGTGASPILTGDRLILCRDTNEASFVEAIEPSTGKTIWRKDRTGFPSGWSTPMVWTRGESRELILYGAYRLTSHDLATGEELWSVPGVADEPCITPVAGDGLIFLTSYNMRTNPEVIGLPEFEKLLADYDKDGNGTLNREEVKPNKSILSRLDADGEGDHPLSGFFRFLDKDKNGELNAAEWQKMFRWLGTFKHANALMAVRPRGAGEDPEIVWQHPRGVPECPSPLYHEGLVYLVKNGGIASCLDAKTGKLHYQQRLGSRGPHYASPVLGDGKIYVASARGQITVYGTGTKLEVLARNTIGERIMATPALVDGCVYVRTEKSVFAFATSR